MRIKNKLGTILFWSVISAAFIGPGTVTTAAAAGAGFGLDLVWVLVVSTFACIVLQVNVTRISIEHDKNLGELLNEKFQKLGFIPGVLGFSVIFGCAAYQAGNLLGASLGVSLLIDIDARWILLVIVALASGMLWFGSVRVVVRILGVIVAVMGVAFMIIAFTAELNFFDFLKAFTIPKIPQGGEIMVMGLIGTTIVPYNLFLGSGLSKGRELSSSIFGLALAITFGGAISIAIIVVGTLVAEPFSFEKLSEALYSGLGSRANWLLGIGLFSAGFTSAMTAPLAALLTYKSIFPGKKKSRSDIVILMVVMGSGLLLGLFNLKPIPVIIMAQALNGIVLPFIAVFILYIVATDKRKAKPRKDFYDTFLLALVVFLIITIGTFNLLKTVFSPGLPLIISSIFLGFLLILFILYFASTRKRRL